MGNNEKDNEKEIVNAKMLNLADNAGTVITTKQRKTMKERFQGLVDGFISAFKDYPITLVLILILAFDLAILVDCDNEKVFETTAIFLVVFAAGSLFSEQLFKKKISASFLVSLSIVFILSVFYSWEFNLDKLWFFGLENQEAIEQYMSLSLVIYFSTAVMVSLFSMFRNSKSNFENFCLSAFTELFKTSVIYTAFAIGLLIVIAIFDVLIVDSGDFIERIEIFLLGAVLAPLSIRAVSNCKQEATKFAKVMVLYVLMPLLILAYAVIYLYIFKIIISRELPSNEVFPILAFLFSIGMPIWTMSQRFIENLVGKIGRIIPFTFIPLHILQWVCIGVRVGQYGITASRYMCIMLLIFEAIYLLLYTIKFIKKNSVVSLTFLLVPIMVFVGTIVPYFNVFDVVIRSQAARFENITNGNIYDISDAAKKNAKSAFREIRYSGYQGDIYIDKNFSKEDINEIGTWDEYSYYSPYADAGSFYYFSNYNKVIDIKGYDTLYRDVHCYNDRAEDTNVNELKFNNDEITLYFDMEEYIKDAIAWQDAGNKDDYLVSHPYFIQNGYKVYVLNMNFRSGEESGITNVSVSCVVLE